MRRDSIARGLLTLAVLSTAALAGRQLFIGTARASLARSCDAWVEVVESTGLRLGCAADPDLAICPELGGGGA